MVSGADMGNQKITFNKKTCERDRKRMKTPFFQTIIYLLSEDSHKVRSQKEMTEKGRKNPVDLSSNQHMSYNANR